MEMFNTLDINKDGTFDSVDVENIKIDNVNRFLGRMKDRFADMEDILRKSFENPVVVDNLFNAETENVPTL